jgi:hypothetical protein
VEKSSTARSKRISETDILKLIRAAAAAFVLVNSCVWAQTGLHLKSSSGAAARNSRPRGSHVILQFTGYPDRAIRETLAGRGITVLQYVPDNALMVSADPAVDLSGIDLLWAGSLTVSDKISPVLAQQTSGAVLAVFHADVRLARARQIARSQGFDVLESPGLLGSELVLSGPLGRLPDLAAFDEVSYLMPASPDLASGATVTGCAGALTEAGPIGEYVFVGKGWPKDAAGKVALGYIIRNLTDKISSSAARSEIERALQEWTRYANFSISPGQQGGPRTIDIQFARGAHGDPYSFDGPGGTLAHTFYPAPPNAEAIAGDMHFDSDEPWHAGSNVDLYSVALHEAGHALGLGHTDRPGTVMYPYYRQVAGLSDDDIAGIRALYGAPASSPASPIQPPSTPTQPVQPTPNQPAADDRTAPAVRILSPGFTILSTTASSIPISGAASDNIAVASVKWTTSTGKSGTAAGTNSWTITVPLLTGTNVITVRAYDAAGNSGWRSLTVVRR